MRTVPIPGGSATLREPSDLKVRHRRIMESAMLAAAPIIGRLPEITVEEAATTKVDDLGMSRQEADRLFELQDATIVALLASWSLPEPLPTMDTVGDMDPEVYEALAEATRAAGRKLAVGAVDFGPSPDPASPTSPSSASDGDLRAETSQSTETSPTGGTSTDTGPSTT